MKKLFLLCFVLAALQTSAQTFNLNDTVAVAKNMREFLLAIRTGDVQKEMLFRADTVLWWETVRRGKAMVIDKESSLSRIEYLDELTFKELHIDTVKRQISRIVYDRVEEGVPMKDRYLFYINAQGKIDGILHIKPMEKIHQDGNNNPSTEVIQKDYASRCMDYSERLERDWDENQDKPERNKVPYLP